MVHFTGRECDVSPYTDAYETIKSIKIACAGMAWMSSALGETYILVFNEGLWMGDKMDHNLINPNQKFTLEVRFKTTPTMTHPYT